MIIIIPQKINSKTEKQLIVSVLIVTKTIKILLNNENRRRIIEQS